MKPLIEKDFANAEKFKVEMEELQRKDKKLRTAAQALRNKKSAKQ